MKGYLKPSEIGSGEAWVTFVAASKKLNSPGKSDKPSEHPLFSNIDVTAHILSFLSLGELRKATLTSRSFLAYRNLQFFIAEDRALLSGISREPDFNFASQEDTLLYLQARGKYIVAIFKAQGTKILHSETGECLATYDTTRFAAYLHARYQPNVIFSRDQILIQFSAGFQALSSSAILVFDTTTKKITLSKESAFLPEKQSLGYRYFVLDPQAPPGLPSVLAIDEEGTPGDEGDPRSYLHKLINRNDPAYEQAISHPDVFMNYAVFSQHLIFVTGHEFWALHKSTGNYFRYKNLSDDSFALQKVFFAEPYVLLVFKNGRNRLKLSRFNLEANQWEEKIYSIRKVDSAHVCAFDGARIGYLKKNIAHIIDYTSGDEVTPESGLPCEHLYLAKNVAYALTKTGLQKWVFPDFMRPAPQPEAEDTERTDEVFSGKKSLRR
ncbi:MAG: hypothetical protein A3E84_00035 [Gammaproteobacteria bacterium RIFCSPHIGHO2_12_FULL_42_13]|nr:MAG: hypothetical protein A3E84_00035 [Gammaproteobacteria bacterium RIFCSPHIGHO2_12_FULL_42_13]